MRRSARTDLCGGQSVMVVPNASTSSNSRREPPSRGRGALSANLLAQLRESCTQRGARNLNVSPVRRVHLLDQRIAPETDSAVRNRLLTTVPFRGAKRPKPKKRVASQKTTITSNGMEIIKKAARLGLQVTPAHA